MRSMKQINNLYWTEGQQRIRADGRNTQDVTSAGWLDQCPDGPPSMDFSEIEA